MHHSATALVLYCRWLTPMRSSARCLRIVIEASVTYLATTSTTYPAGKLLQII